MDARKRRRVGRWTGSWLSAGRRGLNRFPSDRLQEFPEPASGTAQWRESTRRAILPAVTPPVRLLLADDNPDFLASATAHLCARPQLSVVGAARSGAEALTLFNSVPVDLVLLGLNMRGLEGMETTRQFKAWPGAPKVIRVSLEDAPEYRRLALASGADGFIGKAEFATALLPLIATLFPDATP